MDKINHYARFFIILFTAGIIATSVVAESSPLKQDSKPNTEKDSDSQENENASYVQAFDVVSQNIQLNLLTPFVPGEASFDLIEAVSLFLNPGLDAGSSRYFKILFRQIISPNAP
ncbi:MAG: hypothetical protein O2887_04220 [Bacteroidetes bacterium]|nr:hypothetical protein [Bacteroidota bacterium]MDA1119692.1 hypothetical protein [Bacteroidota bacterium]